MALIDDAQSVVRTTGAITAYCHNQQGNKGPAWAKM